METMRMRGKYTIFSENVKTGEKKTETIHNVLTQPFFDALFGFFDQGISGQAADSIDLEYIAIGDGTATALRADTTLDNETFRKGVSSKSDTDTKYTCVLSIDAAEGNPTGGYIKEIGVFADASATPDSGTLVSRANVNVQKNSNIKLLVKWELDTI